MKNRYNLEYRGNILICVVTGKKCSPRICQDCERLSTENYYTKKQAINELLDYCEKNCSKYYQCDRIAELNDKLQEIEESEREI